MFNLLFKTKGTNYLFFPFSFFLCSHTVSSHVFLSRRHRTHRSLSFRLDEGREGQFQEIAFFESCGVWQRRGLFETWDGSGNVCQFYSDCQIHEEVREGKREIEEKKKERGVEERERERETKRERQKWQSRQREREIENREKDLSSMTSSFIITDVCLLVSPKRERAFATNFIRITFSFVRANLNKWKWNSSAIRKPLLRGTRHRGKQKRQTNRGRNGNRTKETETLRLRDRSRGRKETEIDIDSDWYRETKKNRERRRQTESIEGLRRSQRQKKDETQTTRPRDDRGR